TLVTCTATDASGNTNACTFNVTVNDTEAPHAICPANIIVSTAADSCASNETFSASVTDNCPGATVSCDPASGSSFNRGVTTVTCTATDVVGNTNACTFTVTVNDTQNPAIGSWPSNMNQTADPSACNSVVTFSTPTATDQCL